MPKKTSVGKNTSNVTNETGGIGQEQPLNSPESFILLMDTRTPMQLRRGKLVTEIETMASAGMLDQIMFVKEEIAANEAEAIADYIVFGLDPVTIAERKILVRFGQERIRRAVGRQKVIRGGSRR